jgi:hypothetical protein
MPSHRLGGESNRLGKSHSATDGGGVSAKSADSPFLSSLFLLSDDLRKECTTFQSGEPACVRQMGLGNGVSPGLL